MSHPSDKRFQNTSFCDIFAADETGVAGDSSPDSTSGNEFVAENESFRSSPVLEPQNLSPLFKTPINRCIWKRKLSSSSDIALECTKDDVIHCPFSSTPVPSCSRLEKESPGLNLIFATEETFGTISSLVDKKDVSWTSSMATPVHDAQSTSFNTEEKKLLMPSENDSEHSSAPLCSANRVLFSEEADNNAWCEILNLTPKDSDQKTSRTSPVLGGKSDGSYWYWADSQKLVCRTPRRRSSLRRGEKSQLKLPSRRSQFSECKKSENFLFDTNFSQESIFKSSNDRDEELGAHNGERLEKGKANDIHVLESPLMIRNNTENNLSKKHTPSVTQQFSHDLSASMLEEVCLATEIMSSVKNCDDIQDVFQNDSFSEVKECSKIIKNYESCNVDESYIQESNFRDMASITSQAKRTVHILGKDVQTRDSVSEEKESKENVNVNDPSSPVVSLQKYRITNRCNSVLYSKSSQSHILNESVDGSALYEKIMKAALIFGRG
ncbi:Protein of unknown function [Gryllus bimaculatus]|nr:Protein of unknown function [Gryllus bimaculatus]